MSDIKDIHVSSFVESTKGDIAKLLNIINDSKRGGGRNVYQTLPRKMIRRAASEDIRRLPKRLRIIAAKNYANQINSLDKKDIKAIKKLKLYRRVKRQPGLIKLHYALRQKGNMWLETHLWHAKRFKILKQWNYMIPMHPNDKYYRASLKGAGTGCVIQDISFMNCIEVVTSLENFISKFSTIFFPFIRNQDDIHFYQENYFWMFEPGKYPYSAIGPITYMFIPQNNLNFRLWIWVHPCLHDTLLNYLYLLLNLTTNVTPLNVKDQSPIISKVLQFNEREQRLLQNVKNVLRIVDNNPLLTNDRVDINSQNPKCNPLNNNSYKKPLNSHNVTHCIQFVNNSSMANKDYASITLLKNRLIRFRLTGRLALRLLMDTLKPAHNLILRRLKNDSNLNPLQWWSHCFRNDEKNKELLKKQSTIWLELKKLARDIQLNKACFTNFTKKSTNNILNHENVAVTKETQSFIKDFGKIHQTNNNVGCIKLPIIPLFVRDPRLFRAPVKRPLTSYKLAKKKLNVTNETNNLMLARKRKKITLSTKEDKPHPFTKLWQLLRHEPCYQSVMQQPFMDKHVRDQVSLSKLSDSQLNRWRKERSLDKMNKIPTKTLDNETYIPILLVLNALPPEKLSFSPPSDKPRSNFERWEYGWSWDLIIPSNWAMPFWLTLIYAGALPIGLREQNAISVESTMPFYFPLCHPDTQSGRESLEDFACAQKLAFQRKPKDKKIPYHTSNGCKYLESSPHIPNWLELVKDCIAEINSNHDKYLSHSPSPTLKLNSFKDTGQSIYVLRDSGHLCTLNKILLTNSQFMSNNFDKTITPPKTNTTNKHANNVKIFKSFGSKVALKTKIACKINNSKSTVKVILGLQNPFSELEAGKNNIITLISQHLSMITNFKHFIIKHSILSHGAIDIFYSLIPIKISIMQGGTIKPHEPIFGKFETTDSIANILSNNHENDYNKKKFKHKKLKQLDNDTKSTEVESNHFNGSQEVPYKPDHEGYFLLGYTVTGQYSLRQGKDIGHGYISLAALYIFFCRFQDFLVQFRQTHTFLNDKPLHINDGEKCVNGCLDNGINRANEILPLNSGISCKLYVKSRNTKNGYRAITIELARPC